MIYLKNVKATPTKATSCDHDGTLDVLILRDRHSGGYSMVHPGALFCPWQWNRWSINKGHNHGTAYRHYGS